MKITEENKNMMLAVLAANPNASTQPMYHRELIEKTGLTSPMVTAVRKELVQEGKIRETAASSPIEVYLMVEDKRQQILDLVARNGEYGASTFSTYTGLVKAQVHQILLQLVQEGLVAVSYMTVEPSPQLLQSRETEKAPELQAV